MITELLYFWTVRHTGVLGIIYAIISIALIGFIIVAHHIFTVSIDVDTRTYFTAAAIIIAIPLIFPKNLQKKY